MTRQRPAAFLSIAVLMIAAVVAVVWQQGWLLRMRLVTIAPVLQADGETRGVILATWHGFGKRDWTRVHATANGKSASVYARHPSDATAIIGFASPVNPGPVMVRIFQPVLFGQRALTRKITLSLSAMDSFSDGTPDFLRLHNAEDRRAFRAWFTLMADALYDLDPKQLPAGVTDCSGLLRYAYREALLEHDDRWFADRRAAAILTVMPPLPTIAQYHYPDTPLGALLFRVKPGSFAAADLADGSFAQFADAKSLMMWNTHFISHDIHMARPGDVIFYRQLGQNSPYHSMIVTSNDPGAATGAAATLVVYHTGPIGQQAGEVRRMTIDDLLHHPDARWHPSPGNPNFLGVFRWNILREDD